MAVGIRLTQHKTVAELVDQFGGSAAPPVRKRQVSRICAPQHASATDDLIVLTSPRLLPRVQGSQGVILCADGLADRLPASSVWAHSHVMWVVAQLLPADFVPAPTRPACLPPGVRVGTDVEVRPGAVVMAGAELGDGVLIEENAVIYPRVRLGCRVRVGPGTIVGRSGFGWAPGPDGRAVRIPHWGGVEVGDDAEIGPLCTIDAGTLTPTRVGSRVRLDAHVHVAHNVVLGADTWVAAQAGFAGSVTVEERVLVGGQAGIADHVRVGAGARVAAQSGVIGDVRSGASVAGFPAVAKGRLFRALARVLGNERPVRKRSV